MKKDILIPLLIGIGMIIIFFLVSLNLSTVLVFIPGVLITYIFYIKTCYKKAPNPDRILPLYLLALGIQFIHFAEEYVTGFTVEIPKLLGQVEYSKEYWLIFNMVAYFVFILGGIILFKKKKELMIIPLFFIIVGVALNSIGHIMMSIYAKSYVSGLYSALIYLIIGPILIKRVLNDTKKLNLKYK
jgi:Protein of unknown function with HXXEE motif